LVSDNLGGTLLAGPAAWPAGRRRGQMPSNYCGTIADRSDRRRERRADPRLGMLYGAIGPAGFWIMAALCAALPVAGRL